MSPQPAFKNLVVKVLEEAKGQPMSAKDIASKLNCEVQSVNVAMRWLYKDDMVSVDFDRKKIRSNYGSYVKPVFGSYRYTLKSKATT